MYHPNLIWRGPGRRTAGLAVAIAAITTPIGLAAAGADSSPPSDPAAASSDAMAYCTAHLAVETAMASGDPAAIGPAVAAITEAAPPELTDAVATAIANAPTDGPPTPEFTAAYNQMAEWVKDNCGFNAVDVLATEYAFGGVPADVPAGPTVITVTNDGVEMHEFVLVRRGDGVTDPIEELLALPEEEASAKVQPVNATFVAPGEVGYLIADLAPGAYIAICFLPVGATPEMMEEMMAASEAPPGTGSAPEGSAPAGSEPDAHFMHGMVQEFTVGGGTIEVAGTADVIESEASATTTA